MSPLSFYNQGVYNEGIYNLTVSGTAASGTQVAITLDGKTQYLGRADKNNLSIANTWTLGFWAKPFANKEHATFFSTASSREENRIDILTTPIPEETSIHGKRPSEIRVVIKDVNGTTIKHYGWPDWFTDRTWTHTFIQWDGTDLEAFKNGIVTTTGVSFVNTSGSMADSPKRGFYYGSAVAGIFATFSGVLGHFGMWDSILNENEMSTIVSGTFAIDLTTVSGGYVSPGNLQHYWKPGAVDTNIGEDFATSGALPRNLDKLLGIDAENIIADIPT